MYAETPEISGIRAKSAMARVDAKHMFSDVADDLPQALLLTRQNVYGKPCRIGVEAGNLVLQMVSTEFSGVPAYTPKQGEQDQQQ